MKKSIQSMQSQLDEIRITIGNISSQMVAEQASQNADRKLILQTMFEMKNEISQLRKERVSQHSQEHNVNGVSVQSWLTAIGFERYHKLFTSNGIDSMHAVQSLDKGTFDALHFSKAQD